MRLKVKRKRWDEERCGRCSSQAMQAASRGRDRKAADQSPFDPPAGILDCSPMWPTQTSNLQNYKAINLLHFKPLCGRFYVSKTQNKTKTNATEPNWKLLFVGIKKGSCF